MATVTGHDLAEVRALIDQRTGIVFDPARHRFFADRVREHIDHRGLDNSAELLHLVRISNSEYEALLERLLGQGSSFFRYPAVFQALERKVLPEIHMRQFWESPRSLRIWSAGCASGEEPYSIAMTLADTLQFAEVWNIRILATDVRRQALQHAERGVYSWRQLASLDLRQIESYFAKVGDQFLVKPRIRNLVQFATVNLLQGAYLGRFDCIFCMDVLGYFPEGRRVVLVQRLYDCLEPGGYLFLDQADSLHRAPVRFEPVVCGECVIYQKPNNEFPRRSTAAPGEGDRSVT